MQLTTIKKRSDFVACYKQGKSYAARNIILQYRPWSEEKKQYYRQVDSNIQIAYGVTATKKIGCAVVRNRAKRRMRQLVKETIMSQAKPYADYVLVARNSTVTADWEVLKNDLLYVIKKIGCKG